ncbi:unnamed protein product [Dicrocoelium dendriticum]|nr:unnamed protein product [Dicrocoelium dendriticum]
MPYTGGVFVSSDFQPAKLVRYLTTTDYFVMGCEIIYLLFVIYYIIEEIVEVIQMKWRYLSDVWNLLDVAVLGVSVTCAIFTVCSNVAAVQVMNQLLENMDSYPHFDRLSYWYAHFARATAMCVFLVILKIFKYVNFDKSLGQLTKTLSEAAADLFGFLVMFCIVYFAFAQFGYLAFGADTEGFQSFTHSW